MSLEPGTKIGPYEIVSAIRTTDVGELYKASDTRIHRAVTITVVSSGLQIEAPKLAALKHPSICGVLDVGDFDGAGFIVTEYLDGETLAQRLARGRLDLEEALKAAIAIAGALDQAHRQGLVHRRLNPSTIFMTANGPKLMDFGLAKTDETPSSVHTVSTMTTRASALPLASDPAPAALYLAPEQWEGSEADARTDVFALGAVVYEMVAGKPAFEGKTPALLIAAIQTIDPEPLSKLQPAAPPALEYVLNRCLTKNPKLRLQSAWELMNQLQWILEAGSQIGAAAPIAARRRKQERLIWIAAAASLLLAAVLAPAAYRYMRGTPEAGEIRFVVPVLGAPAAGGPPIAISPDGRWIARSPGSPNRGLDAIALRSAARQSLIGGDVVTQPFWSPDNRSVAFFEDGMLKRAEISGGPAQNICAAPGSISAGTWSKDGVIIFPSGNVLQRVLATGGQPSPITALDSSKQETEHLAPFFLPDDRHYLFLAVSSQPSESVIYVGSLGSKERTRLFASDSRAVYAEPGYILFNRSDAIFAQPFDPKKLALTGEPIRIADGVSFVTNGPNVSASLARTASFAVSQSGVLAYRSGTGATPAAGPTSLSLFWLDRSGVRTGQVGGPGFYAGVDLSPDGKKVAVHVHDGAGGDSWFFDTSQGRMQRLTFGAAQENSMPMWSPDGTKVAFASRRNGKWGIYTKLADGTGAEELITESEPPKAPMSWTPDGKMIVYWVSDPRTRGDVWAVPISGDKKPAPILQTQYEELHPQISPDGKWIAYSSNETARFEIYIKPFPEGPGKWQVSTDGGIWPRWRHDGNELFFVSAPNVLAADIQVAGASVQAGAPHVLFGLTSNPSPFTHALEFHRYAVSADGAHFLIPQVGGGALTSGGLADAIATAADQGRSVGAATDAITVVLNWPRLLRKR